MGPPRWPLRAATPSCSLLHTTSLGLFIFGRGNGERGAELRKEGGTMGANAGRLGQRSHDAGVSSCPGGLASPPPVPTTQLMPGYEATLRWEVNSFRSKEGREI